MNGAFTLKGIEAEEFIAGDIPPFVYDPRQNKFIESNNPILIFADIIKGLFLSSDIKLKTLDPSKAAFWEEICSLADLVEYE